MVKDNIKSDYLREIGPENSGLYNVIKRSIQQGKFPTQWKVGKVSCLHKKGSKQDPNNYRPITLLSIPSKVLEKMIYIQLSDHFAAHNILCDNQWGFPYWSFNKINYFEDDRTVEQSVRLW